MTIFKRIRCGIALLLLANVAHAADEASTTPQTSAAAQLANPIQTSTAQPNGRDFVAVPLNKAACDGEDFPIQLNYNLTGAIGVTAQARLRFFLLDSRSCLTATPTSYLYDELLLGLTAAQRTISVFPDPIDAATLSARKILNLANACTTPVDQAEYAVCVIIDNETTVTPTKHQGYLPVNVDTLAPGAPTDLASTESDSSVVLKWTAPSDDVNSYTVTTTDQTGKVTTQTVANAATTTRVENLVNGQAYSFTVRAVDAAGNEGPDSAPVSGAPRDECNYWKCYEGKERGGYCFITTAAYGSYDAEEVRVFRGFRDLVLAKTALGQKLILAYYRHGARPAAWLARHDSTRVLVAKVLVAPRAAAQFVLQSSLGDVAWAALATVLIAALAWRTRRLRVVAPFLVLLWAGPAFASSDSAFSDELGERRDEEYSAPRDRTERPWLGFNLKFGSYRPNIDSDPSANNIYQLFFGKSDQYVTGAGRKVWGAIEADFYFLRSFGLLGVSGSVGYWQAAGKTRVCHDASGAATACSATALATADLTNDSVQFTMFPLAISLVYKFDFLLEKWGVPLVPFVRFGLDAVFWRVDSGGKQAKRRDGKSGNGSTYGWHLRPGLAINLDWIEPDTARRAFHAAGVHGTYLTFEWTFNELNDFRSARSWDLSDSSFLAGVAVDIGF